MVFFLSKTLHLLPTSFAFAARMHASVVGSSRKRKRGERVFRFESFCEPGHPTWFNGCFLENMMALVEFGHGEAQATEGLQWWSFKLELRQQPSMFVRLFIVQDIVEASPYRYCYYCRSVGWGHHMVCNKRFHLVLCSKEANPMVGTMRLDAILTGPEASKTGSNRAMESQGVLMHGVIHGSGFGHLICIKGVEGGSEFLSGHQIMFLWDRLCTALQLRMVSLIDMATKGTMELRLVHGVAYGHSWFGHWGYKFIHGSYGITPQMYHKSIDALQTLPLCLLIPNFTYFSHDLPFLLAKYQAISPHTLLSLGDLIHYMLELKRRLPANSLTATDYRSIATESTCRWSAKRVEMAAKVIVGELKKSEFRWVSRQEVRDAARAYIGDTGLLDYVLKSLGNHIVGDYIVCRAVNPVTKVLEYCLEDACGNRACSFGKNVRSMLNVTRAQVLQDLLCLYKHVLKGRIPPGSASGLVGALPIAVRIVVDSKNFVKDYQQLRQSRHVVQPDNNTKSMQEEHATLTLTLTLMCTVKVVDNQSSDDTKALPPYELMLMPMKTTFGELKRSVEMKFRDIYLGLKSFVAEMVVNVSAKDSELVREYVENGSSVVVEGRVGEEEGLGFMFESSGGESVVDCRCGARAEDGERMIMCDICEVSRHARCAGVPEGEELPTVFLCSQCERDIVAFPVIQY